ncbi:ubiquitin-conjugating enzyme E2Z [Tothia fuscella]|uniref:Ubiquitin-conjugating enzyme E2Z n=1 Tax=Tothia fuscella TaxID=1048955 RepID=A0A9P4P3C8_9PEZI|nr:ubiquitin-conjugating enzyme E2Z [Tothia fuscella]
MSDQSIIRITRELHEIQKGGDLSIAAAFRDCNVRHVYALIIGPPDTPYEFGFFEFYCKFGKDYPTKAPSVNAMTTNMGRTRFNPNIYAAGKVCLSILGTWRGERGEEWSSAQGLESILISIQSLMSGNPYENEPGFEDVKSDEDKKNAQSYVDKIRHETLRTSIIERLEDYLAIPRDAPKLLATSMLPEHTHVNGSSSDDFEMGGDLTFEPFKDKCKLRFLWYYDSYHQTIDKEAVKFKDGVKFERMPFEGQGNTMDGAYQYTSLKRRLTTIKERMDQETERWAEEGKVAITREMSIATNLKRQYEQTIELYKQQDAIPVDIELVDNNPFVWQVTLVGRYNTNLDGGIVKARVNISPRFPTEQPRVRVETPLFHHRISSNGQLCYFSSQSDNLSQHIQAIISAIEDEDPAYDPRTLVNPEASKLLWGNADDKKVYNRRLRRSVADSLDLRDSRQESPA